MLHIKLLILLNFQTRRVHALKTLAPPCARHPSEIGLPCPRPLQSTLVAAVTAFSLFLHRLMSQEEYISGFSITGTHLQVIM